MGRVECLVARNFFRGGPVGASGGKLAPVKTVVRR
ncbi:hypothetical protein PC129_g12429 [Phytophthora cactorum]|uniref:Uncharacterized protein n=1 Tax=Phytophthora cactorum TaxID=29920 RepID=A0A8T1KCM7_9STRA|nr:hypothetical protein Pcac1_g8235 [Phytophthora cactorum]KAG2814796.1 hypothetical protein PC112_g14167 [Phytophthora cactorum]KAG2816338.1 hypothetical protein PC111_g13181 [Phytophthora cactorum]KAG2853070.1 hypothetical protein PC113_g14484 [Phytophthora cactorum]KAG2895725.1 hypothetical protein PC114_g15402 [Phytophthora cactorum]